MATTASAPVGFEELGEHECLRLLGTAHLGRLALSVGALPAVFPIYFALLGRDPVFRTDEGTKLAAASSGHVVCLEADDVDVELHSGWSVMVIGSAHVMTDPDDIATARKLPLRPWVGSGDVYVQIHSGIVTGRRMSGIAPGTRPR